MNKKETLVVINVFNLISVVCALILTLFCNCVLDAFAFYGQLIIFIGFNIVILYLSLTGKSIPTNSPGVRISADIATLVFGLILIFINTIDLLFSFSGYDAYVILFYLLVVSAGLISIVGSYKILKMSKNERK